MNIALDKLKLSESKQAENAQLQFFSWSGEACTVQLLPTFYCMAWCKTATNSDSKPRQSWSS